LSKHRRTFERAYLSRGIVRSLEEWALRHNRNAETVIQRHINVKEVLSKNILLPVENILDVGCGSGFFLRRLSVEYDPSSLCGIDISSFQLENANTTTSRLEGPKVRQKMSQ